MTTNPEFTPDDRKGECQGNRERCSRAKEGTCPIFGLLVKPSKDGKRRVKGCGDPVARGKRNRTMGDAKARKARKVLGIPGVMSRHEEHWGGAARVEMKAGKQVGPIATRFHDAEAQSEAARPMGDHRPFAMVAMPEGESDGIVLVRLSKVREFAHALVEMDS